MMKNKVKSPFVVKEYHVLLVSCKKNNSKLLRSGDPRSCPVFPFGTQQNYNIINKQRKNKLK